MRESQRRYALATASGDVGVWEGITDNTLVVFDHRHDHELLAGGARILHLTCPGFVVVA